jgi:hypothetical protein
VYSKSVSRKLIASPRSRLSASAMAIGTIFLACILAAPARSQESQSQAESVADAAWAARKRIANSTQHPKVITNADLGVHEPVPSTSAFRLPSASSNAAEASDLATVTCDSPEADNLKMQLQAAEQDLARLRSELSYQPPVISNRDLDLQYFQPGNSGLNVGSPPLLDSEPPAPARVAEVELQERIASLQKALRLKCEPPDAASIQIQIDDLKQQMDLLQRQFALDQDAYYSQPNFAEDSAGKTQLDAEQQQIQALQAEIDQLRQQLAALNLPQA